MAEDANRVVIIGSGPTAIGAAIRLYELIHQGEVDAEVMILEAADRVGGLASSVTSPRGFTWDLGVHVTGQSKYHEFLSTIDAAVGEWNYIPRCVQASMRHVFGATRDVRDCYVPYPVQDSIAHFPPSIREQCQKEMDELANNNSSNGALSPSANFNEFALKTFGETLTRLFIRPYNEKVWTVALSAMDSCWVEGRVPKPRIKEEGDEAAKQPTVVFRYPRKLRGVGALWEKVVGQRLPQHWLHLNSRVAAIDVESKQIALANGFLLPYDTIISTMPLDELGRLSGLAPSLPLSHSKVLLVGIGLRVPQPPHTETLSWLYFPQHDTIFYRVTFVSNFNECLTPNAALFWSVLCEIGMAADAEVDEEAVVEKTIKDLEKEGIIEGDAVVEDRWMHVLPYGYPIPTLNRDETLREAQSLFESHNIFSRGRFGSWRYEVANQDHSFTMGREVVDRIFRGEKETVHSV